MEFILATRSKTISRYTSNTIPQKHSSELAFVLFFFPYYIYPTHCDLRSLLILYVPFPLCTLLCYSCMSLLFFVMFLLIQSCSSINTLLWCCDVVMIGVHCTTRLWRDYRRTSIRPCHFTTGLSRPRGWGGNHVGGEVGYFSHPTTPVTYFPYSHPFFLWCGLLIGE